MKSPRSVYEWVRRFFNIDTPREREWSLVKTGSVSLLFIAVYIILFCFFSETVSKFPDSLVALIVAFPIAWILWVWRNQDKQRTIEFEELSENTRKLLLLGETITNPATSEPVQRTAFWGLIPFLGNVKNLDVFQQTLHFINAYYRLVYDERTKLNDKARIFTEKKDKLLSVEKRQVFESKIKKSKKKAQCLKKRSESYLEIIYYGLKAMNVRVDKIGPFALREMEIGCNIGTILTNEFASWNFEKSTIHNWSITRKTFSSCSFNSASFAYSCEFNNCKFIECDFSDTHLFESRFINCSFQICNFYKINWEETLFQDCKFEGPVFGIYHNTLVDPKIPPSVREMLTAYHQKNDFPPTALEAMKKMQSPTNEQR